MSGIAANSKDASPMKRSNVTIYSVAAEAGVSIATVSRALNGGSAAVAPGTAERVYRACEKLRYVPDRVAAGLKGKRTATLGFVVPDLGNPFFAQIAAGLEHGLSGLGMSLLLGASDGSTAREAEVCRRLLERRVDAIVVAPVGDPSHMHLLVEWDLPTVLVDTEQVRMKHFDCVTADHRGGARAAVEHLLSLGHRDIGVIAGPERDVSSALRVAGAVAAAEDHGTSIALHRVRHGDFSVQGGYEACEALLADRELSALFTCNNLMTIGALRALKQRQVSIPAEMAVVGFDDEPWCTLIEPALTTVAQPAREIGLEAAAMLRRRLAGERPPPEETVLASRLIVRASAVAR